MTISLTNDQESWLRAHVACGEFPSIAEAVRQLLDEQIAQRRLAEDDDLAWAKPYVDEALAEVARADVITLEDHERRMAAVVASQSR